MKCPDCGSQNFYVKDPEDKFNIHEFSVATGKIVYTDNHTEGNSLQILEDTETYCDGCAWHDKYMILQKTK